MAVAQRPALAHAALVALEEQIRVRANERRHFYRSALGRSWPDWKAENDLLLRELFRVRRAAKAAMRSESRALSLGDHFAFPDAIQAAKWERERLLGGSL